MHNYAYILSATNGDVIHGPKLQSIGPGKSRLIKLTLTLTVKHTDYWVCIDEYKLGGESGKWDVTLYT